jgi:hypothetical protein
MSKHRDFSTGDQFPAGWLDALNEYIGSQVSPNLTISKVNSTTLKIAGASGNGQVAAAIQGQWRFNSADITAAAPANAAGTYPIYLTSQTNNTAQEDAGTFNYGFAMKLSTAPTGSGAEAISRQIGSYVWDGTGIVRWTDTRTDGLIPFLKLAVMGSERKLDFGSVAPGSWGGVNQIDVTIGHNLGVTPIFAVGIFNSIATFTSGGTEYPVVVSIFGMTSTNVTFRCRTADAGQTNNAKPFYWLAVG